MQDNVLIVGGAGFIGSHLVDLCLEHDENVWVYDNFATGRREFLPKNRKLHMVEGDILDEPRLAASLSESQPAVVFHLAAIHHIPTCEAMPARALRVNIEGTQSVLSACSRFGVPRVVFTSTGALYDPGVSDPLTESHPVSAKDVYSISKLAGEHLVQYYVSKHGARAVVARLFNTVGRHETNSHVVPAIMAQLAAGKRRIRLGNLHPRRDYVHVEDVAQALLLLASAPLRQPFDTVNVGSGSEHSVQELVDLCAEVIGEPIEIVSDPERRRKVDRLTQLADVTKIRNHYGWQPVRSLKQALREIWDERSDRIRTLASPADTTGDSG